MPLLRPLFRFFDLVREETTPNRVAAGITLGIGLGMLPIVSAQFPIVVLIALLLRVQIPAVVLGWIGARIVAPLFDPLLGWVGLYFLKGAALRTTWSWIYHAPLLPFFQFNNSVILGLHLTSTVAAPLIYFSLTRVLGKHWGWLATRGSYTPAWQRWQASRLLSLYREYRLAVPQGPVQKKWTWLRFEGALLVGAAIVSIPVLGWFAKDDFLKRQIETTASRLNGARVDIGGLVFSPFSGEIKLTDIQIGNPSSPSRNLFQIQDARISLVLGPLVRKKILFRDFILTGVRIDTERGESALLAESETQQGVTGLIERSAPGYYSDVRNALKLNPLKYLGSLSSGLSLNPRVDHLKTKLETLKALEKQEREVELISAQWEAGRLKLPTSDWLEKIHQKLSHLDLKNPEAAQADLQATRKEIASAMGAINEIAASLSESLGGVQRGIASLDQNLDADIARVKEELKLPDLSASDLTSQLFGNPVLKFLERAAYWIDLTRRKMPLGDPGQTMTLVLRPATRGTDAFFANRSGLPELLIPHITLAPGTNTNEKGLVGQIYGLTSEPSFYRHPMGAALEANTPDRHIENVKFTFIVDHTQDAFKESLAIQAGALPLTRVALHDSSNLTVHIERAILSFTLAAQFQDNHMKADWNAQLDDVQYGVTSRFLADETALKRIIGPVQTVNLTGQATGPTDQMRLTMASNLGKTVAEGLRREFRHPMAAVDDNIRRSVLDRAEPTRRSLASRVSQLRQGALQTVSRSLKSLQDLASEADTLKGRLEHPKGKTTASSRRPRL